MTKSKQVILSIIMAATGLFTLVPVSQVSAISTTPPTTIAKSWKACDSNLLGFPPWYRYLTMNDNCTPRISKITDVWVIALNILDMLIRVAGIVAVGFVIWGGFKFMKSQGEPGKIIEARTVIINAVIGLVIVIAAVALVQYVAGGISG